MNESKRRKRDERELKLAFERAGDPWGGRKRKPRIRPVMRGRVRFVPPKPKGDEEKAEQNRRQE
jgi:hypothetical protein